MISSKKVAIEPRAGVNEGKICPKTAENCKYSYFQYNNSNTIESFCMFLSLLGKHEYYDFKPKTGHKTNKNSCKVAKNRKYFYLHTIVLILSNFSIYFCFSEKAYLSIMISRKTSPWELWTKNGPPDKK